MQSNSQSNKNEQGVNLVDLSVYLLSKWKWFVLSVLVFGGLAWYHYATSPLVFFRSVTVIIKDPSNKTSTAGLDRYDNYINKVNVANEILQFRSKRLMREVVQRLHADVDYRMGEGPAHRRALQPLAGERLLHQRDARATYLLRRDAAQRQYRDAVRLRGASRREGVLRRAAQRHAESRRRAHPCDRHRPLGQVVDGPRDTRHQEPAERRGRAVPGQHGHPPGGGRVLHSRALAEGRLAQARRGRAQHAGQRV